MRTTFYARWSTRYTASATTADAPNDFCGITYKRLDNGSLTLSCGKLMLAMEALLAPYRVDDAFDTPMAADTLTRIR